MKLRIIGFVYNQFNGLDSKVEFRSFEKMDEAKDFVETFILPKEKQFDVISIMDDNTGASFDYIINERT